VHISPRGAGLDETSRADEVPSPFKPRRVGLVETHFVEDKSFIFTPQGWAVETQ
jgi:hypothetical protein